MDDSNLSGYDCQIVLLKGMIPHFLESHFNGWVSQLPEMDDHFFSKNLWMFPRIPTSFQWMVSDAGFFLTQNNGYIMAIYGYIVAIYGYIWLYCGYIMAILWLYMAILWLYMAILWLYYGYIVAL